MFQFEKNGMYQMPVHFGPCCGPRRGPDGKRFYEKGPQESTQHTLVYETDPEVLKMYLPEGFLLRRPYVIVIHKMHRNLPWLAGHGYNVTAFNVPVTYYGQKETVIGNYQLAIWENHADPIICGREQLGYSKIFADIEDIRKNSNVETAALSSWGFKFLNLKFRFNEKPNENNLKELKSVLFDPENEGLLHYKYIPHSEAGFNIPDVCYVALTPNNFKIPDNTKPLPAPERIWCQGELQWSIPRWEDMPTQYHIVQGLASLPVIRYIGASRVYLQHYNDVYHQRAVY